MRTEGILALTLMCVTLAGAAPAQDADPPLANWVAPPYWTPGAQPRPDEDPSRGVVERADGMQAHAEALPSAPLPFVAIAPCRIVDTRQPISDGFHQPNFGNDESRSFPFPSSTDCPGLPFTAGAWSVNVQFRPMTQLSFLTAYPTGTLMPVVSTVTASPAAWVQNAAIVPAGTGGAIDIYCQYAGRVIIDINGYYGPQSVVTSLTGGGSTLTGDVTLAPGSHITITPSGNTLTIADTGELTLPYSGSAGSSGPALSVTNTGIGDGIRGVGTSGAGVYGTSSSAYGVEGWVNAPLYAGVYGVNNSGTGVYGWSQTGEGVHGESVGDSGVRGHTRDGFAAVYGDSTDHHGVYGWSDNSNGVQGGSYAARGISGTSATNDGVEGIAYVSGKSGVYAVNTDPGGYGGYFVGKVQVVGNLAATGVKSFVIDHPLDPTGRELWHAAVESSEVVTLYSGNAVTDAEGRAVVRLPDWFEALNTDFRYQLTCIGQFAQAIVERKMEDNRFTIRTNLPAVEVSWLLTARRHDPWMKSHPFSVERDKPEAERGTYLAPVEYGQPEDKGVERVRHPESPCPRDDHSRPATGRR